MRVFVIEKYKDNDLKKICDFGEILTCDPARAKVLHKAGVAKIIDDNELEKAKTTIEKLKLELAKKDGK